MKRIYRYCKWKDLASEILNGHRVRLYSQSDAKSLINAVRRTGYNARQQKEQHCGQTSYVVVPT